MKTRNQFKKARRKSGGQFIMVLKKFGYKVDRITDYQYRIDNELDLYPTNKRFHNLITQERGPYVHILNTVKEQIGKKSKTKVFISYVKNLFDSKKNRK